MSFGADREVHTKHKFLVQSSLSFAAFQKMSELSGEFADIEYFEGGALIPIKVPGRLTYADVTLERGSTNNFEMYEWFLLAGDASKGGPGQAVGGKGLKNPLFKKDDLAVQQLDLDNSVLREWQLIGSYPKKFTAGDWDNTVDEVVITMLVLRYDYFRKVASSS